MVSVGISSLGCSELLVRAFSSAAPQIWNHIPAAIKVSPSNDSFKRHLKTHYFTSP